ncbi:alpha/beta hydrolase [Azospirillum canadense]|uniref:alpha/beta hydrolase n=1 Tax=Azospirillum canadense TaxID=403962 RepID=UPI00222795E1|nr:alpha/beta hydrolase-fold protein [Azospirillum canadense]MCW2238727.1 enterochelin esterase-like enzyme [Azospirillum canadense]
MTSFGTIIRATLTLFATLAAMVTAVPEPASAGTVQELSLASSTLGAEYRYTVYLPDGYGDDGTTYPVLYLLHGSAGNERDWLDKGGVAATLDRLIADRKVPATVVVMPGHRAMWWVDGHAGQSETVLLKELLPEVERRFHVYADRTGRAFGGLSAGAHATIRLAFTRPDLFAAGIALSPAIYTPMPPPNSSIYKDPPFFKDGRFDEEMWTRLNWPALIDGYRAQPLRIPLYLNSGDRDRFEIAYHAAVLYRELFRLQPDAVRFRVVDGDHEWRVWNQTIGDALEYALPYLRAPGKAESRTAGAN